jgi:hypothetical protein
MHVSETEIKEAKLTPDYWIRVNYLDIPGSAAGMTFMSLSELFSWLEDRPGTVITRLEVA